MPRSDAPAATRRCTARAKLNLSLHVLGRRSDGYHELDSQIAFAELGDTVAVAPAGALSLDLDGPYAAAVPAGDDNLVLRAARLLAGHAGRDPGARIMLTKRLPVAAGLGGGSADAAAALLALSRLWRLDLRPEALAALALQLGADVPVCLYGRSAYVSGIGERIGPAPHLPEAWLVLANPGEPLGTAAVFEAHERRASHPIRRWDTPAADAAALAARLREDGNDLEATAARLQPRIREVLHALAETGGCLLARMSGSGATCFALYADHGAAEAAAAQLSAAAHGWWVRVARLAG